MKSLPYLSLLLVLLLAACQKEEEPIVNTNSDTLIRFKLRFDPNQERLNNIGQVVGIPAGHAAQSPVFNSMSLHYIEFVPTKFTMVGDGAVVYEGASQIAQGSSSFDRAIDFERAVLGKEGEIMLEVPLNQLSPGTYEYLRTSVTYQNADVRFNLKNLPAPLPASLDNQLGTIAGFIGFNTYISQHQVKNQTLAVNADKAQGFWAFEPQLDAPYQDLYTNYVNATGLESGQAPEGSTTVVNLLQAFGVSLPQGSCIVTGQLDEPLVITGNETADLEVSLSFSINQSFEWVDQNSNGAWDMDIGNQQIEPVVDMGLRGLKVRVD
ncbi:MAG: hypothetical protein AAFP19_18270 [Bacteroidota bacterium]